MSTVGEKIANYAFKVFISRRPRSTTWLIDKYRLQYLHKSGPSDPEVLPVL